MRALNDVGRIFWMAVLSLTLAACSDSRAEHVTAAPDYAAMGRGEVTVSGGLLSLFPKTCGMVSDLEVSPGQKVHRGEVLLRLDGRAAQLDVDIARARLQQAKAQEHVLAVQLPSLQRDRKRWAAAVRAGAAEQERADSAQDAVARLQAKLAVARAAVALAQQHLTLVRQQAQWLTVRAPVDGTVIDIHVQTGSRVEPGGDKPVLTLLPHRPLIVRAEVNEAYVHRLHVGMAASLTLDAQPGAHPIPATLVRVGQVLRVARLGVDPQSQQRRVVDCILSLKASPHLLIGQHVMVKFHE
ncbi:HlyD family secretion protein [Mangrovitalea sediminis]|uniref:HlyD family secretion protein n=1 Tax=Mangrovitalea sediminis TaxID=1982043 RepID=UPI000BE581D5|nr:HlyD family efflux transporter periplasmic adaptor subunit [Mangrovitalea sediminis]